jgi:hypothetical protein
MAEKPLREEIARLDKLSPEARERVTTAMREALEREVNVTAAGGLKLAAQFSRGWIFSRVVSASPETEAVLPEVLRMSEEDFSKFADRLTRLKREKETIDKELRQ